MERCSARDHGAAFASSFLRFLGTQKCRWLRESALPTGVLSFRLPLFFWLWIYALCRAMAAQNGFTVTKTGRSSRCR
jgi:hypothetical protein